MQTNLIPKLEDKNIRTATKDYSTLGAIVTEIYQNNGRRFFNGSFSIISPDQKKLNKYLNSIPFFKFYTQKEITQPLDGEIYPINIFQTQKITSDSHPDLYIAQNIPLTKIPINTETDNFGVMLFNKENLTDWTNKSNALSDLIYVQQYKFDSKFYR